MTGNEMKRECVKILLMEDPAAEKIQHLKECESCRNFVEEAALWKEMLKKTALQENSRVPEELDMKILSAAGFSLAARTRRKAQRKKMLGIAASIAVITFAFLLLLGRTGEEEFSGRGKESRRELNVKIARKVTVPSGAAREKNPSADPLESMDALTCELMALSNQLDTVSYGADWMEYQS